MPRLQIYHDRRLALDGRVLRPPNSSLDVPSFVIDVDGYFKGERKTLAATTTWDFWEAGAEEPLSDFDYFEVRASGLIYVELTIDKGAEVGTVVSAISIPANRTWYLTDDGALALHTADFATGSLDVIDRIRIRNPGSSAVIVDPFMVT
jgi:hypothetical protein